MEAISVVDHVEILLEVDVKKIRAVQCIIHGRTCSLMHVYWCYERSQSHITPPEILLLPVALRSEQGRPQGGGGQARVAWGFYPVMLFLDAAGM